MTPAEIAKALTPAQVRALRDANGKCGIYTIYNLLRRDLISDWIVGCRDLTPLGRAVLAELDKEAT